MSAAVVPIGEEEAKRIRAMLAELTPRRIGAWADAHPALYRAWIDYVESHPREVSPAERAARQNPDYRWWGEVGPARPLDVTDIRRLWYSRLQVEFGTMMISEDGEQKTFGFLATDGRFYVKKNYAFSMQTPMGFEPNAIVEHLGAHRIVEIADERIYLQCGEGYARPALPVRSEDGFVDHVVVFEGIERISLELVVPAGLRRSELPTRRYIFSEDRASEFAWIEIPLP